MPVRKYLIASSFVGGLVLAAGRRAASTQLWYRAWHLLCAQQNNVQTFCLSVHLVQSREDCRVQSSHGSLYFE